MARPPRFERGTLCLEGRCSIQLSYGRSQKNISGWPASAQARLSGQPTCLRPGRLGASAEYIVTYDKDLLDLDRPFVKATRKIPLKLARREGVF